jgi:chaperonin GroES
MSTNTYQEEIKMALKLKPLADRLVIEPIEGEEITASGIYVPDTAKEKPQEGKVLAVGPGRKDEDGDRIAMDVAEGDRVLYAKYAGTEVKLDDKKYLILKESDVLAILE